MTYIEKTLEEIDQEMYFWSYKDEASGFCFLKKEKIRDFVKQALLAQQALFEQCVPEVRVAGGDYMDNDECEKIRGFNACRNEILNKIKNL